MTRQMDDTEIADLLEAAWGLIANAGGGDWSHESDEWNAAAVHWRSRYKLFLDARSHNNEGSEIK